MLEEVGIFVSGFLGASLSTFLAMWEVREKNKAERPKRDRYYWSMSGIMSCVGGGLALYHSWSGNDVTPLLALNIGASAPLIIQAAVKRTPQLSPGTTDSGDSA